MDIEQFRKDFTEFDASGSYPDALIKFWSGLAERSISKDCAGELYTPLTELATAHYITIAANNAASSSAGSPPGTGGGGVVSSKMVGDVSVSYDTAIAAKAAVGDWNRTTYGQQYHQLMIQLGAGAVQI